MDAEQGVIEIVSVETDEVEGTIGPRRITGLVTNTTTLELSPEFAAACRWIADLPTGAVFDMDDLRHSVPALSAAQAPTLLAALEKTYLVRPYIAGDDVDDEYSATAEAERIAAGMDNGGSWI